MPAGPLPKEIISSEKKKKEKFILLLSFLRGEGRRRGGGGREQTPDLKGSQFIPLQNDGKHSGVPIYLNIKAYIKQ